MHPLLVKIPFWLPWVGSFTIPIHTYGTMLVVAMFAALFLVRRLIRSSGIRMSDVQVLDLLVVAVMTGVVGARLVYVLRNPGEFSEEWSGAFKVWRGGLVFHGGVLGGLVGIVWYLRRHHLPVFRTGDVLMPGLLLGLAWGRIGCFLNGCCYGEVAEGWPLAVRFPRGSPAWYEHSQEIGEDAVCSLPVHPTQIYESVAAAALGLLLIRVLSRKRFDGQVVAVAALSYAAVRFGLEFLRGDVPRHGGMFTAAQIISAGLFALGAVLYAVLARRAKASPSP
jgi:phosphatidylglycerol:prolipoprotein diacylglycerol transferase